MRLNLNYYYMKECTALDQRGYSNTLYQQDPEHQTSSCPTALKSDFWWWTSWIFDICYAIIIFLPYPMLGMTSKDFEIFVRVTGKRSILMHKFTV